MERERERGRVREWKEEGGRREVTMRSAIYSGSINTSYGNRNTQVSKKLETDLSGE